MCWSCPPNKKAMGLAHLKRHFKLPDLRRILERTSLGCCSALVPPFFVTPWRGWVPLFERSERIPLRTRRGLTITKKPLSFETISEAKFAHQNETLALS